MVSVRTVRGIRTMPWVDGAVGSRDQPALRSRFVLSNTERSASFRHFIFSFDFIFYEWIFRCEMEQRLLSRRRTGKVRCRSFHSVLSVVNYIGGEGSHYQKRCVVRTKYVS